jgi:hypothetical protein
LRVPDARGWVDARTIVWNWSEVAEWFETRLGEQVARGNETHAVAALNGALETRRRDALTA